MIGGTQLSSLPLIWFWQCNLFTSNVCYWLCCIRSLYQVINSTSDGGITALHMAALNGHVDSVHLLIELGASVSEATIEDGTTIDLIGRFQYMNFLLGTTSYPP